MKTENTKISDKKPAVRWRTYEVLFVSVVTFLAIAGNYFAISQFTVNEILDYRMKFLANKSDFTSPFFNIFIPQTLLILSFYMTYITINFQIVTDIKKLIQKTENPYFVYQLFLIFANTIACIYFLVFMANLCSYMAQPQLFNYHRFGLFSLFGFNESNVAFSFKNGVFESSVLFFAFCGYVLTREVIIYVIEKIVSKKEYKVLIINQVTGFTFIYFSIPFILSTFNLAQEGFYRGYFVFIPPSFFTVMYCLYWLFPRKAEKAFNNFAMIGYLVLSTCLFTLPFGFILKDYSGYPIPFFTEWIIQLLIVAPLAYLIFRFRKDKILSIRTLELALEKSTYDLSYLRSQINPHFLFNTLNSLYGLALSEKANQTAEAIQKLGDMMRFMLHDNSLDAIPLEKEINYVTNYIDLQKMRIQKSPLIEVETDIDQQIDDQKIAPMLLIPLVENAFKHGISLQSKSWIRIKIQISKTELTMEIRNSIHKTISTEIQEVKSGVGSKNVKERLQLLYPEKSELKVTENEQEFQIHLKIQL